MKFTFFRFKNFKGIESQTLDLSKNVDSKVFTLVGLNESGKTTVLEAINYFVFKPENLNVLKLDNYEVEDIHNLIPINKRDNFNDSIEIEAGLELDDEDIEAIRKDLKLSTVHLTKHSKRVVYTQKYFFENSIHIKTRNESTWVYDFHGTIGKGKVENRIKNEHAKLAHQVIIKRMPSILYFPNFLFEFPERIYLDEATLEPKYKFYQKIVQDILDSLGNNTNIKEHLKNRIESDDEKDKRSLNSLIGKMQKQLTEVIFNKWNQI